MNQANQNGYGREQVERTCQALAQSEIEIAFSLLQLADVEIQGGNGKHAAELIGKATVTHNSAIEYLGNVPPGFEEQKRELWMSARRLFEAIRAAERRRRHAVDHETLLRTV